MSQTPPVGQGQCSNCQQFQPYTKQICDFCSARLPWAVQQTVPPVMTPPPLPRYPVQPSPQPSGGKNNTTMIVVGVAVLFFIVLPTIGIITLSILGNRVKNQFDAANAALVTTSAASNQVSTSQISNDCGLMNTAECDWTHTAQSSFAQFNASPPASETNLEMVTRHKNELSSVKSSWAALPQTPPRCLYASTKFTAALDEISIGCQMEEDAYTTGNSTEWHDASQHFNKAADLLDMADGSLIDLTKIPGPKN